MEPEELQVFRATAAALASRGAWIRSGGAEGADTAAAEGTGQAHLDSLILALPNAAHPAHRDWAAALRWTAPYPPEIELLARWEWEGGEKLPIDATPDLLAGLTAKVAAGRSWHWLRTDRPKVAELMVRNAAIIAGLPGDGPAAWTTHDLPVRLDLAPRPVRGRKKPAAVAPAAADLVQEAATLASALAAMATPHEPGMPMDLAALRPESAAPVLPSVIGWPVPPTVAAGVARGATAKADAVVAWFDPTHRKGGGTGHGWRLARALGIPAFNLRLMEDRERLRAWCEMALPGKPKSTRSMKR